MDVTIESTAFVSTEISSSNLLDNKSNSLLLISRCGGVRPESQSL